MRRRNFLTAASSSLIPGVVTSWAFNPAMAEPSVRSEGGVRAGDVIIVSNPKDSSEMAAAQELQSFLSRITRVQPRMVAADPQADADRATTRFLVGRTPATEELITSGKFEDPAKKTAEAYTVRSINSDGKPHLAFLGGTGIPTLYAAYHYLEKACGCGSYWDGDHVPIARLYLSKALISQPSLISASACA